MTGLALLLDENPTYKTHEVSLDAGDAVILYTDGLYEVHGRDREVFGMERVVDLLGDRINATLPDLFQHLISAAHEFSDEDDFQDDVCLLGVELAPR